MNFIIKTKSAEAGEICSLYVQGLTQDVWKSYISVDPNGHYLITGKWGTGEIDARHLLKQEIMKEICKWACHPDPRPSQTRRWDLLKQALECCF